MRDDDELLDVKPKKVNIVDMDGNILYEYDNKKDKIEYNKLEA